MNNPIVKNSGFKFRVFKSSKRFLDVTAGLASYFILSPLIISIIILLRITQGKDVFFRQVRPGYQGKPFMLYKFRTMADHHGKHGNLLSDEERLTAMGKILRATSMDELPELINVIKGEMSFVGPRPLLMQYLERYTNEQARRHEVKPGITGWAQVNGRNAISWEEKFQLDNWYVDHQSFSLDLNILCMTFFKVLKREGITQIGHATMEEFRGCKN